MNIFFNNPYTTGKEVHFIKEAVASGKTAGNGPFSKKCTEFLEAKYGFNHCLLTSSCTDALEMCALLADISPGDEVIVPSYTFVSTALAFVRQGAKIVFADSRADNPCIDEEKIEDLITSKTKVIVPVHYAGLSCEMDRIMGIAERHNLLVVEDAAHAFGSRYKGKLLGTIGHLGCFSFHETKIIHCGEGGMLSVNDERFTKRAEIIWEKGTNRCDFHRGQVKKYEWIDTGSSFLLSDISAAFLYSQLLESERIIGHRKSQWALYHEALKGIGNDGSVKLPSDSPDSVSNKSGFYLITGSRRERDRLLDLLNENGIQALSHYLDLGESPFIRQHQPGNYNNPNSRRYQDTLLRLPLFNNLTSEQITLITDMIIDFYGRK
jgi:dTDP-4-amino-4,6-dideoxygalactose transaminase